MSEHLITFQSVGEPIAGLLYLPARRPLGAIVTAGPLTSVKEQAVGAYAKAMATREYAALAFDHRYFGQSGGQPRQFENPLAKIEDIGNAVTFLENDERTSGVPVYAIGICAGGGYMARAVAGLPRIRAFAGIAGVYSDAARTKASMGAGFDEAIERAQAAEARWRQTGYSEMIPAVAPGNGDVAMPLDEAYEFYGTARGAVANYVNNFAVQSRAYTLTFDVQNAAPAIKAPTLIVHSEKALVPAWARSFFMALAAPKEELWISSKGQIDFYDDPNIINPAADAVARFFEKWR